MVALILPSNPSLMSPYKKIRDFLIILIYVVITVTTITITMGHLTKLLHVLVETFSSVQETELRRFWALRPNASGIKVCISTIKNQEERLASTTPWQIEKINSLEANVSLLKFKKYFIKSGLTLRLTQGNDCSCSSHPWGGKA